MFARVCVCVVVVAVGMSRIERRILGEACAPRRAIIRPGPRLPGTKNATFCWSHRPPTLRDTAGGHPSCLGQHRAGRCAGWGSLRRASPPSLGLLGKQAVHLLVCRVALCRRAAVPVRGSVLVVAWARPVPVRAGALVPALEAWVFSRVLLGGTVACAWSRQSAPRRGKGIL